MKDFKKIFYLICCVLPLCFARCKPIVTITSPANGDTFEAGETISFEGQATGLLHQDLADDAFVWTSDKDGKIGTGTSFASSDLSEGKHIITLTVTSPNGQSGLSSVIITVGNGSVSTTTTTIADYCGDDICSGNETVENCQQDCFNEDWNNLCDNGNNYEITTNQRIYLDGIRKPTSYILSGGTIHLGIRNTDTNESKYSLNYVFTTNEPAKISITGSTAKNIIHDYNEYTIGIDVFIPQLSNCENIKQPGRIMVGDPFLGERTAFVYPKDIIPSEVLDPQQEWSDTSVGQMMKDYNFTEVTDVVRALQEKMFASRSLDGDVLLMGLMPSWCGAAGQPIGFGVGCLIQLNNQPHWGIVFHEMGHMAENFLGEAQDGMGGVYSNNAKYFSEIDKGSIGGFMYAEGVATLSALYAEKNILLNNQDYNFSVKVIDGINTQFEADHSRFIDDLSNYESSGSNFSNINANILDGIFIHIAETEIINKFGWEIYPRFFKLYQNPLPSFVQERLTELQGHTYFVAGLSAAAGNDLRFLFRDKWNFPIDNYYFKEIYPLLKDKVDLDDN